MVTWPEKLIFKVIYLSNQSISISTRRVQCTTVWFSRHPPSRMSQCLQGKHCIDIKYLDISDVQIIKDQIECTSRCNLKTSFTSHSLQSSRQNWSRFKSLWGIRLRRTLNFEFHCLQTSVPGICYHPLLIEWPSHVYSYQMFLKSILDQNFDPYTFLYIVCSWLYYTGTFVVMCLNTCDRKHLQTWNNFTLVANNHFF